MNKFLIILLSLGLLLFGSFVYAAPANDCEQYCSDTDNYDMPTDSVCYCNPLTGDGLESITDPIISFIFKLSIVIVPVLVTYGAFMIVTAAGDPERIKKAKEIIFWTLIGFIIVLLSRGISDLIEVIIGI